MKALSLAMAALRKRQSPRTGFVHFFPGSEGIADTIPMYENFCFALALFRSKTSAEVLEGKEVLKRLLDFQTEEGNFPVYLHEYPRCWDRLLPLKLAPIFDVLYTCPLGEALTEQLRLVERKLLGFASSTREKKPFLPLWEQRFQAWNGRLADVEYTTAEEWLEGILSHQLAKVPLKRLPPYGLQAFLGQHEEQEGSEPKPAVIEWWLAGEEFSPRLLKDHPLQMYLPPLLPLERREEEKISWWGGFAAQKARLLWPGCQLHSLVTEGALTACSVEEEGMTGLFSLQGPMPSTREDLIEVACYVDISPETELFVNGKKATVFRLGDEVVIHSGKFRLQMEFTLKEGEGDFIGQISKKNRPRQTAPGVYDWSIALRTLRRSDPCAIKWRVSLLASHPRN